MRIAREVITTLLILIAMYLLFVHSSGFAQDVTAGFSGVTKLTTALQGR